MTGARPAGGFTLIEVLVALGIVAIALTAGLRATAALTDNAMRQSDILLAHLCAENELVKARLSQQMPGVGDNELGCEQGNRRFAVTVTVRPTQNPSFRRMDAKVSDGGTPILTLSTVIGRYWPASRCQRRAPRQHFADHTGVSPWSNCWWPSP